MNTIQRNDLPTPGTPIEGGFFAGLININGEQFGVVVSPKDTGDLEGTWGKYDQETDATSICDGAANTQAMATAGSEIAAHVLALDLNGHADWYIPSRDELELVYRNLKPSTTGNYKGYRSGENPTSTPIGLGYTPDTPTQTPVSEFQSGGDQAMEERWYWSSTQYSAYSAFVQDFDDGDQSLGDKDHRLRVRAVRRFKVTD